MHTLSNRLTLCIITRINQAVATLSPSPLNKIYINILVDFSLMLIYNKLNTCREVVVMPGVTAKDIAAKLNISQSAVSLALNGKPGVSENTRALVLETAMQLGYSRPDASSAPCSPKTICFVRYAGKFVQIAEHTSFASFVLQGVESRATELGYGTQVRYLNAGDMYNPQTLEFIRNADGLIFLGTDITEAQLPELEQLFGYLGATPVVVVDSSLLSNRADCVTNDCFGGAKAAAEYLLQTGHRQIGYVKAKQRIRNLDERELGVRSALERSGLQIADTIEVDVSSEGAFQDFDAWIKGDPPLPEALFAENDILAAAVIRVLKKHGYRVPDDISVIGFDDIPMCEMLDPPLTTIHAFKEELGTVAVDLLDRRIKRGEVPHQMASVGLLNTTVSTSLVKRFSVKAR